MKHTRNLTWLLLAVLPLLYFNCAQSKSHLNPPAAAQNDDGLGSLVPATPTNALSTFVVQADGKILVWQDKELNYSPSGGASGVYTISALPSWATFDTLTGTVKGVPRNMADTGTFTISKVGGQSYGPYTVSVVGDTYKEEQWHLINTGQKAYSLQGGVADQDIHLKETVKSNILGTGVTIAISDTGSYVAHPDLKDNLLAGQSRNYGVNYNVTQSWLGDPTPTSVDKENAHGTAVAGLAAAKGWNGVGGRGAAPEAHFASFLFLQAQDQLAAYGLTNLALYDQFAGNFDIFNFSWGDPQCVLTEYNQSYSDKLAAGITGQRFGKGSVYLIAAGNSFVEDVNDCDSSVAAGTDYVLGNASFSEINTTPFSINVAAVSAAGVTTSYSTPGSAIWISSTGGEYGWSKTQAGNPEVSYPALITSDYPGCSNGLSFLDKDNSVFDNGTDNPNCNYVNTMNGTSGATPVASGAVALLLQANPSLSWRDVKYILAKTAEKIHPNVPAQTHPVASLDLPGHTYEMPWITNAAGFHFHNWYGFGRIHIDDAVALAKSYTFPLGTFKSTAWKHDSGAINVQVTDNSAVGITRTQAVADVMTIEAVQLRVSVSACASDIGLELTSPSGTKSIVMNINSKLRDGAIVDHVFLSNAFYGEQTAGTWTLKVIDGKAACTNARLTNWKLNFSGY